MRTTGSTLEREDDAPDGTEQAGPAERQAGIADGALLAVVVVVGVLVDLWWQTPLAGAAAFGAVTLLAVALTTVGPVRSRAGRVLTLLAVVPAAFLALRTSPWLTVVDLLGVAVLLLLGVAFGRGGRLFASGFRQLVRAGAEGLATMATTPPPPLSWLARLRMPAAGRHRRRAAVRGLLLTVPLVVVLASVLASGDAVFADLLEISFDPWGALPHLVVVLLGAWVATGLFAQASRGSFPQAKPAPFAVGPIEAMVVLAGLIAVYSLFAVARLLVALRGADYVVETTGLTAAEYARSGFFQLLWAAGLTLLVLLTLRATVRFDSTRSRRAFAVLVVVAVGLTLLMVHAAISRLALYEDAYGLTMLRLSCTVFAWWIAGVFVLTGVALVGVGRQRSWLPAAMLLSAVLALLAFNLLDPEAQIVQRNVDRATSPTSSAIEPLDVGYLLGLSDDAVPALVDALPSLSAEQRDEVLADLCRTPSDQPADQSTDWNRSALRAEEARRQACGSS